VTGRAYATFSLLWLIAVVLWMLLRGGITEAWWLLPLGLAVALLPATVHAVLVSAPSYEPPVGSTVLLTIQRHEDWPPILMRLQLAGIDAQLVEEPHKSFGRRLGHALYVDHFSQPFGPWHVVVSTASLDRARQVSGELRSHGVTGEVHPA
jgi:hypothetical protein